MPSVRRDCGRDRHRRSVTRSICVKNKVARACKHGARGAGGKCPKGIRMIKARKAKAVKAIAGIDALRQKYPKAFK